MIKVQFFKDEVQSGNNKNVARVGYGMNRIQCNAISNIVLKAALKDESTFM